MRTQCTIGSLHASILGVRLRSGRDRWRRTNRSGCRRIGCRRAGPCWISSSDVCTGRAHGTCHPRNRSPRWRQTNVAARAGPAVQPSGGRWRPTSRLHGSRPHDAPGTEAAREAIAMPRARGDVREAGWRSRRGGGERRVGQCKSVPIVLQINP